LRESAAKFEEQTCPSSGVAALAKPHSNEFDRPRKNVAKGVEDDLNSRKRKENQELTATGGVLLSVPPNRPELSTKDLEILQQLWPSIPSEVRQMILTTAKLSARREETPP
jgi:hypothetical protein